MRYATTFALCSSAIAMAVSGAAAAQTADPASAETSAAGGEPQGGDAAPAEQSGGLQDIVVTANKRAETANKVGMSITAVQGEALVSKGITDPGQLIKIVPGFNAVEAPRGTPVYSIRGIGFDDSSLASNPTVALYTDEVPLTFPVEGRFATLDLERVEVLKGPQGILFGQNSTAGAINFIAAKPTDTLTAGFDGTYGRFNYINVSGFLSGPVTDTLKVRVSAMGVHSGDWQKSYTRNDSLGAKRQFAARLLADWNPTDRLHIALNVNGWSDKSDTQASQLIEVKPNIASTPNLIVDGYPRAPQNARAADWDPTPPSPLKRDDNFLQVSVRGDYDLTDAITFTSISSWSRYNQDFTQDTGGVNVEAFTLSSVGKIRSFNQEARFAGELGNLKWIVGGNYERDKTQDNTFYYYGASSSTIGFLGIHDALADSNIPIRTLAAFSNVDYSFSDVLTVHAGIRYTDDKRSFSGCTRDPDTDGTFRTAFSTILGILGTPNEIQPGGCTTSAVNAQGVRLPVLVVRRLHENNVSWRLGLDAQITPTTLLYANVSQGYKAGAFPAVNTADAFQLNSVTQEKVLAYEAGVKSGLFDRRLQLNAAGFYYDYTNKQLRGRILDTSGFFGVLEALVNIPKSRVWGVEISAQSAPIAGLNISLAGTYVNSKVTGDYMNYDPAGNLINYKGLAFPHTPKWNATASIDYDFALTDGIGGFVGGNLVYQSRTSGLFVNKAVLAASQPSPVARPGAFYDPRTFDVKAFTTVDARVGIKSADDQWRAWLWGKNIFNTYYWNNVTSSLDTIYRLASPPATYGASVSFRF